MDACGHRHSRYRYEQRFTTVAWMLLLVLGASLAAYHSWETNRSASDDRGSPPIAPTTSMRDWLAQSQSSINYVVTARNNIAAAASRKDIPGTGTACQTATEAVAMMRDHMPVPEAAVNQPMQQALSNYTTGLPFCVSAAGNADGEGMQMAARFISQGDEAMQVALDALGEEPDAQRGKFGVLIV